MACIHTAIFRWKPGTPAEQVARALDLVRAVAGRVEGISIYCGENSSRWSQGFTHAVVVIGTDQQAIDNYRKDSVHEEAAKLIDAIELEGVGVDFQDR